MFFNFVSTVGFAPGSARPASRLPSAAPLPALGFDGFADELDLADDLECDFDCEDCACGDCECCLEGCCLADD